MADSKCKRKYREKVRCSACNKVVNSDYKDTYADTKHTGQKVKFSPVLEADQSVLTYGSLANPIRVKKQYPHADSQLSLQGPSFASDVSDAVSVHQPSDKDDDDE